MFEKRKKFELKVEGMHCSKCQERIEKALQEEKGIKKIQSSLPEKSVSFELSKERELEKIKNKIEDLGYEVKEIIEKD